VHIGIWVAKLLSNETLSVGANLLASTAHMTAAFTVTVDKTSSLTIPDHSNTFLCTNHTQFQKNQIPKLNSSNFNVPPRNTQIKCYLSDQTQSHRHDIFVFYYTLCGPGRSVGIATGYELDGPGIECRWVRDFPHLSRPALGPPPSLLYNGYRVFPRGKGRMRCHDDPSPPSRAVVKKE